MKKTDNTNTGLRCRSGDQAVIVRAPIAGLEKIVGCYLECENLCISISGVLREPVWHVKPLSPVLAMLQINHMPDSCLRPIRGAPGKDESLEWVSVPKPTRVPA